MNTKMLEQLHCMMYSNTSDTVYENLGGDEEEGGGRGEVLSLYLSPPSIPPSLPPTFASGKTLVSFKVCNSFCDEK